MGLFDKFFEKNEKTGGKIKIKFVSSANEPDEHEQFLKPAEPMMVKVETAPEEKTKTESKATTRKSTVVKRTVENKTADNEKNSERKVKTVIKTAEKKSPADNASKLDAKKADTAKTDVTTTKSGVKTVIKVAKSTDKTAVKTEKTASASSKKSAAKATAKPAAEVEEDTLYTKDSVTVSESKETRSGKFDIQRAKDGRFFFNLYASNHTVIAYSQIYSSTSAAMTGIKSIIANAATTPIEDTTLKKPVSLPCPKWEIYIDKAGEYRFRLYATNGLCICHSAHGYSTKSGCKGGIDSIGRFASDAAKIDKSYLK